MSHYCRTITATRQLDRESCSICQGQATDAEIAEIHREVRKPHGVGIRDFWTGTPGTGTLERPIERRPYKGKTVKRIP